jgi:hypothetical protein
MKLIVDFYKKSKQYHFLVHPLVGTKIPNGQPGIKIITIDNLEFFVIQHLVCILKHKHNV